MNDHKQPRSKARLSRTGASESMYPRFDIDVPMPSDTPIPPRVVIIPSPPLGGPVASDTTLSEAFPPPSR